MHTPDGILMYPVAHIRSDFPTKFGIPKQSGLSQALEARVVFCPEYRSADAVRGLEEFSHIWLLWQFSAAVREGETFSQRTFFVAAVIKTSVFGVITQEILYFV